MLFFKRMIKLGILFLLCKALNSTGSKDSKEQDILSATPSESHELTASQDYQALKNLLNHGKSKAKRVPHKPRA
jgi:hypothetical protein